MNNPMRDGFLKRETQSQTLPANFVQWLDMLLRHEQGRALISQQLQRHELPVIEFEPA
jgi:hypothetical protein